MACSKADFGGQRGHDPRDIKSIYVANFVIATNAPQNLQTSYIRQVGRLAPPPRTAPAPQRPLCVLGCYMH